MALLQDNIKTIKGIGEKKAQAFAKLGVVTLYDLLSFFPRRYEDRSQIVPIAGAEDGANVCISAVVADEPRLARIRRGMELVKFKVFDDSGMLEVTYFNQSWMKNNISRGEEYVFYGRMECKGQRRTMANPVYEKADAPRGVTGRIMPVYPMSRGLTQKVIAQSVRSGLDACVQQLPEPIPAELMRRLKLADAAYAYENVHFPADFEALRQARRRLVFEELFLLACALERRRAGRVEKPGLRFGAPDMEAFYARLPFSPTGAQKRAVREALADMASGRAMNRLLQGDVGSGKTLCAAALAWAAHRNGSMTAFMAPTEILAEQHCKTLTGLLAPLGMRVEKLTGAMTVREKHAVKRALADGEIDLLVGTHALFTDDVVYPRLGLVITDEQHRFGVGQRAALAAKSETVHMLVMSATPIPRTLALIIYGDLDVSILDEMPPGRQKVDTFAVDSRYRERLNGFIRRQAENGNQVYVVCPAVEESENESMLSLKSAERTAEELQAALPELRRQLGTDLEAAYQGDPAARSRDEIILCYPAFPAIAAYRLAHVLYREGVPLLPRMMTEYAHRRTGIDIHPGAAIGDYFFIDHGTGVVIGETTTIGEHVKLYQHVTLGAKSFEVGPDGTLVKGIKRHPDIGDRVVIYAGATILGGSTRIGSDCVIGGSVWLTHSIPAGKMVLARSTVLDAPLTKDLISDPILDSAML